MKALYSCGFCGKKGKKIIYTFWENKKLRDKVMRHVLGDTCMRSTKNIFFDHCVPFFTRSLRRFAGGFSFTATNLLS